MGTDNSHIEFSAGTLYFSKPDDSFEKLGDATDIVDLAIEEYDDYIDDALSTISKWTDEELSFTATCELSFKAEVMLFGFWNALRRRIQMIFRR